MAANKVLLVDDDPGIIEVLKLERGLSGIHMHAG